MYSPDMRTVNIHAAKTQLSRLVEAAATGEEIIIAKSGKPMVPWAARRPPTKAPSAHSGRKIACA
jgi:antitoxin (DNA-binding transcriptional repressor) of toxin-antitoxin stability system